MRVTRARRDRGLVAGNGSDAGQRRRGIGRSIVSGAAARTTMGRRTTSAPKIPSPWRASAASTRSPRAIARQGPAEARRSAADGVQFASPAGVSREQAPSEGTVIAGHWADRPRSVVVPARDRPDCRHGSARRAARTRRARQQTCYVGHRDPRRIAPPPHRSWANGFVVDRRGQRPHASGDRLASRARRAGGSITGCHGPAAPARE